MPCAARTVLAKPGDLSVEPVLGIPRASRTPSDAYALAVLASSDASHVSRAPSAGLVRAEALLLLSGQAPGAFAVRIDDDFDGVTRVEEFSNERLAGVFASIHTLGGKPAEVEKR